MSCLLFIDKCLFYVCAVVTPKIQFCQCFIHFQNFPYFFSSIICNICICSKKTACYPSVNLYRNGFLINCKGQVFGVLYFSTKLYSVHMLPYLQLDYLFMWKYGFQPKKSICSFFLTPYTQFP